MSREDELKAFIFIAQQSHQFVHDKEKEKQVQVEACYFDVLPLHPRPEKLESLTSYLMRLAEVNCIKAVAHLNEVCFSDYLQARHHLNDFPMRPLRVLQTTAQCSEAEVQAMTLYHVGEKFGRTFHPNACYLFLQHSIAHSLRYCPHCLQERGYYSLLWRFQPLKGCAEHGCTLLDTCWHCGATIPVFPFQSMTRIGVCPSCWKNLGEGHSRPLQPKERDEAQSFSRDLAFLLSPLPPETSGIPLEYRIGKQFTRLRQAQGLSVPEVAKQTMLPSHKVVGVEFDFPDTYTTSFECYTQYVKVLGRSFHSIFEEALVCWNSEEVTQACQVQVSEEEVIDRVMKAVDVLITRRRPMSKRAVLKLAQLLHAPVISSTTLLQRLEYILFTGRAEQRRKTALKNKMLAQEVLGVMRSLEEAGKPVTYGSISHTMNFSYASLEEDLWDIQAVNDSISRLLCHQQLLTEEEDILLTKIEVAVDQLEEIGVSAVRGAILQVVGCREEYLNRYPRVRVLLSNVPIIPSLGTKNRNTSRFPDK